VIKPLRAPEPPIKIGGPWQRLGKGPAGDVEARVAYGLVNAPETAEYTSGVKLTEFRVSEVLDGYRVILKGRSRGKPRIAFVHATTWRDAIRLAVTMLDSAHVPWGRDTWTYPA